jgi:DNA-binding transcriptional MerR regulator
MGSNVSIREMANRCGLSPYTLRYYERAGLIRPVTRAASGHRRYSVSDEAWVAFLNRLRTTGMSIRQMEQFARLRAQGDVSVSARRAMLETHVGVVQSRVAALEDSLVALATKIEHYAALERSMTSRTTQQHLQRERHGKSIRPRTKKAGRDRRRAR